MFCVYTKSAIVKSAKPMRILSLIDDDHFFRNYINSGAFNSLLKLPDFKICVEENATQFISRVSKDKIYSLYQRSVKNKNLVAVFNQISMWAKRKFVKTFDIKIKSGRYTFKERLIYSLFSKPILFNLIKTITLKRFEKNNSLEKIIKRFKPELVIFPYAGYEGTAIDLILLSKKFDFQSLFLIHGWDNLSSKGVFLKLPDFMGVWGSQSLVHAVNIQGMKAENCFLLGCPRYEDYFILKKANQKHFPFKYIVFAGSQTAHDEISPLKILDKSIEESELKIKIIYRPHPNRQKREGNDFFNKSDFKNVILDPQVEKDYYFNKEAGKEVATSKNLPELDYLPGLLNHALFIISPLSSLIIEAAIYDVPSLILANSEDVNPMSPKDHSLWTHFEGARQVPGWYFVDNLKDLKAKFKKMLNEYANDNFNRRKLKGISSAAIKNYLYYDNKFYSDRLNELISLINKIKSS